jgi:hypothetical protein
MQETERHTAPSTDQQQAEQVERLARVLELPLEKALAVRENESYQSDRDSSSAKELVEKALRKKCPFRNTSTTEENNEVKETRTQKKKAKTTSPRLELSVVKFRYAKLHQPVR